MDSQLPDSQHPDQFRGFLQRDGAELQEMMWDVVGRVVHNDIECHGMMQMVQDGADWY